jgi:hypothetical protein
MNNTEKCKSRTTDSLMIPPSPCPATRRTSCIMIRHDFQALFPAGSYKELLMMRSRLPGFGVGGSLVSLQGRPLLTAGRWRGPESAKPIAPFRYHSRTTQVMLRAVLDDSSASFKSRCKMSAMQKSDRGFPTSRRTTETILVALILLNVKFPLYIT